jgi:hypothetical protein
MHFTLLFFCHFFYIKIKIRTEAACCGSMQPAAAQCSLLRLNAACCGSSAHPKSHVHGMPCTPNPSMRPTYSRSLLRLNAACCGSLSSLLRLNAACCGSMQPAAAH